MNVYTSARGTSFQNIKAFESLLLEAKEKELVDSRKGSYEGFESNLKKKYGKSLKSYISKVQEGQYWKSMITTILMVLACISV